jgi:hypothetical protein
MFGALLYIDIKNNIPIVASTENPLNRGKRKNIMQQFLVKLTVPIHTTFKS